jgi:hypothetical protein
MDIFNTPDNCVSLGTSLAHTEPSFRWGDFNGTGIQKWHVPMYVSYEAGTWNPNYDCPVFTVVLVNEQEAVAWTQIKYNLNDF